MHHDHDDLTSTKGDITPTILDMFDHFCIYLSSGAPPSTESNTLFWIHVLVPHAALFGLRTFEKLVPVPLGRISRLRPDSIRFISRAPLKKRP